MARPLRTEFCRYDNPHKLGVRDLEAGLFCDAFEHDVEVYH